MPWTIKNISSTIGWGIKNISSAINWVESVAHNVLRWQHVFYKWEDMPLKWKDSTYDINDWSIKNINTGNRTARDYEWDDSTKIWSAMTVNWNSALIEGDASWIISTKNSSTWTKHTISD